MTVVTPARPWSSEPVEALAAGAMIALVASAPAESTVAARTRVGRMSLLRVRPRTGVDVYTPVSRARGGRMQFSQKI
jgi:hypothetical protein